MFDVGFWELALIALIGLIVIGPERLPAVARTLGGWAGRARMYMNSLTAELEREVHTDELKRHFQQTRDQVDEVRTDLERSQSEMTALINRQNESGANAGPADTDHADSAGTSDKR